MAVAVRHVVELVRPDRPVGFGLGELGGEPAGEPHVVVGIGVGDGGHLDELGAAQPQGVLLLLALGLRDDDDAAEAERVADQREPDPGVAGGSLDDHAAGAQLALAHRVLDDEQPGAILDRLARVHELGLAENLAARLLGRALEFDQRGIADGRNDAVTNLHWASAGMKIGPDRRASPWRYAMRAAPAKGGLVAR